MGHMVGLVVVVAGCLMMVSVVSLGINRAVMGLGVADRVNVVWVHRIVVVRVFIGGCLVGNVVSRSDAILISSMVTVGVSILGRERMVHSMLVVVDWLNITLVIILVVERTVCWVISRDVLIEVSSLVMITLVRVVDRLEELDHEDVLLFIIMGLVVHPVKEFSDTDVVVLKE